MLRFGRMVCAGGVLDGRRYLSPEAMRAMTTPEPCTNGSPGMGWGKGTKEAGFGHGGALATDLYIDPARQLTAIYLVQQAGYAGPGGETILPGFKRAAGEAFASR